MDSISIFWTTGAWFTRTNMSWNSWRDKIDVEIATNSALKITCKNENTAEDIVVSPCDTNNQNAPVNEIWHNESMKRKHLNANKSDHKKWFATYPVVFSVESWYHKFDNYRRKINEKFSGVYFWSNIIFKNKNCWMPKLFKELTIWYLKLSNLGIYIWISVCSVVMTQNINFINPKSFVRDF